MKTQVYLNNTKVIVVEPTRVDTVFEAWIFDKHPTKGLVPSAPEHHSVVTLKEFIQHYGAKRVNKQLVLGEVPVPV
jgi:hypothetical protein